MCFGGVFAQHTDITFPQMVFPPEKIIFDQKTKFFYLNPILDIVWNLVQFKWHLFLLFVIFFDNKITQQKSE